MSVRSSSPGPEFSVPVAVDSLPAVGLYKALEASPEQRRRLATRFALVDLPLLTAEFEITPARAGEAVAVTGEFVAHVVQRCVVTLEPLPAEIRSAIEVLFVRDPETLERGQGQADLGGEEDVEPLDDDTIDLGELVAQNLGIAIDPYPRKAGVSLPANVAGAAPAEAKTNNPFVELAKIDPKSKE